MAFSIGIDFPATNTLQSTAEAMFMQISQCCAMQLHFWKFFGMKLMLAQGAVFNRKNFLQAQTSLKSHAWKKLCLKKSGRGHTSCEQRWIIAAIMSYQKSQDIFRKALIININHISDAQPLGTPGTLGASVSICRPSFFWCVPQHCLSLWIEI